MTSVRASVVLCTYNRAQSAVRAVRSVLAQAGDDVEVVVVDDGSTDDTADVLADVSDPRLEVVSRPNGGLAAARNTGIEVARGRWLIPLDDDDSPADGWLDALLAHDDDPSCGLVCCGYDLVDPDGNLLESRPPRDLGPLLRNVVGSFLAGTFAVRADLLRDAGGYLDGLGASHQNELFIRLIETAATAGLEVRTDPGRLIRIVRRPPGARPLSTPPLLFDAARWMLARHAPAFERAPEARSDFQAVAGVNAARLNRWSDARRFLRSSAASSPGSIRPWGRALASTVPGIGRRLWQVDTDSPRGTAPRGIVLQTADRDTGTQRQELFLPWGYRTNPPTSADLAGTPFWDGGLATNDVRYQRPVYRLAARILRRSPVPVVVDVGCGSGHKLVAHLGTAGAKLVGVDQPSGIELARTAFPAHRWIAGDLDDPALWDEVGDTGPGFVICADVIEHVDHPVQLLRRLRDLIGPDGALLLSTPDRDVLETGSRQGPPHNRRHVREWSMLEFDLLLESVGLEVQRRWHLLPRSYSLDNTDVKRTVYRALHRRAIPDRRSCMVFLARRSQVIPRTRS